MVPGLDTCFLLPKGEEMDAMTLTSTPSSFSSAGLDVKASCFFVVVVVRREWVT